MSTLRKPRWPRGVIVTAVVLAGLGTAPAHAQFGWFGSSEASPQDVSDTIAEHGFRLVGPLYRNGRVYLADVVDRRQRRERLVISAESGQIVQRYRVDVGNSRREAPPPPRDESFFSRLSRGWDDEPPPRPPAAMTEPDIVSVPRAPSTPKPKRKVVTRTEPTSVTTSPLAPTAPTPDKPQDASAAPETVATPPVATPSAAPAPAPSTRATSVSTDPLRIPGKRKPEDTKPAAPTPAAVATRAAEPTPPATKPKAASTSKTGDVPVAPLD